MRYQQLTTFIFLSDVTEEDGPTRIVPYDTGQGRPVHSSLIEFGALADHEVAAVGPAGNPAPVPDRHPAPRFQPHRRQIISVLDPGRLSGPGNHLGGKDGVAEAITPSMGQIDPALHRAGARSLRVSAAWPRLLERADAGGHRPPLSGPRPRALPAFRVRWPREVHRRSPTESDPAAASCAYLDANCRENPHDRPTSAMLSPCANWAEMIETRVRCR